MQKLIKEKIGGIFQVTTLSERWYAKPLSPDRPAIDKITGLPIGYKFVPSSTWIASYYPKNIYFYKWLADKGWDEAEAIKNAAGIRGTKVHKATELIDVGKAIRMEDKFLNPRNGIREELTVDEYGYILAFKEWIDDTKPILLASEMTIFGEWNKYQWGGTLDRIYAIGLVKVGVRQIVILDIKTSKNIWEEHKIQLGSYSNANIDYKALGITDEEWANRKNAILQLKPTRKIKNYKYTEIEDRFDMFKVAIKIWRNENPRAKVQQAQYPLFIQSEFRKKQLLTNNK